MSEYLIARTSWLDDMEGLSDSERGRLFTALLMFAASGEKQEPRGTERVLFNKMCRECANDVQMHKDDVQMSNIDINKHKDLSTQVSTKERKNTTPFDTFWDSYPVKVNKKRCAELWKKLNPDEELVKNMLSSIEAWKQTRQWREGYVPYPDTWLRGEKWNDEIPADPRNRIKNTGYASRIITDDQIQFVDLNEEPKRMPKKNPALRYAQTPISEADFNTLIVDLEND